MLSLRVVTEASYMVEDARLLEGQPQNWQCHFCILPVKEGNKDSSDSRGKGSRFIVISEAAMFKQKWKKLLAAYCICS